MTSRKPPSQPPPLKTARMVVAGHHLLVFRETASAGLRLSHGLSRAEEEVVALLLQGLALNEVAAQRMTTVGTVGRQAMAACHKLGVVDERPGSSP